MEGHSWPLARLSPPFTAGGHETRQTPFLFRFVPSAARRRTGQIGQDHGALGIEPAVNGRPGNRSPVNGAGRIVAHRSPGVATGTLAPRDEAEPRGSAFPGRRLGTTAAQGGAISGLTPTARQTEAEPRGRAFPGRSLGTRAERGWEAET
jgi:hypothetical protein